MHLSDDDLERYLMGQIPDDAELAQVEEHVIACVACQKRAEAMGDYITAMKEALKVANGGDDAKTSWPR